MCRKDFGNSVSEIGLERVERLLDLAEKAWGEDRDLSDRYVELAWRIKTRYNLELPHVLKIKFCRKCRRLLVPDSSCRVRLNSGRVVVTCLNCDNKKRYPINQI